MFKSAKLHCPKCGHKWEYSYWQWIFKTLFHWLHWDKETKSLRDYRRTKCPVCGKYSWIKRQK